MREQVGTEAGTAARRGADGRALSATRDGANDSTGYCANTGSHGSRFATSFALLFVYAADHAISAVVVVNAR